MMILLRRKIEHRRGVLQTGCKGQLYILVKKGNIDPVSQCVITLCVHIVCLFWPEGQKGRHSTLYDIHCAGDNVSNPLYGVQCS